MFVIWNERAIPRRARWYASSAVISRSLNQMRPSLGGSRPLSKLKNVVFPAPFGPMIVRTPPSGISRLTLLTAVNPETRRARFSVLKTYDIENFLGHRLGGSGGATRGARSMVWRDATQPVRHRLGGFLGRDFGCDAGIDRRELFLHVGLDARAAREQPPDRVGEAVVPDVVEESH